MTKGHPILIAFCVVSLCGCSEPMQTAAVPAQTVPVALEGLLAVRNPLSCEMGEPFMRLQESLVIRREDERLTLGVPSLPPDYRRAIGSPTLEEDQGNYRLALPVNGTWLGLPVNEIAWAYPVGGDPPAITVRFEAAQAQVLAALNRAGFAIPPGGNREFEEENDVYTTYVGIITDGRQTEFTCAWG